MVARLAARGIGVLPTLAATPGWVTDKPTTPPIETEADRNAWRAFVTAVVRRYGAAGSFWTPTHKGGKSPFHIQCRCGARPQPVKALQIWNEPNLKHYFTPEPAPGKYAALVKISHSAVKNVNPKEKVVLAGLSQTPRTSDYLRSFYRVRDIKASFDAVSVHPYARNIGDLRRAMKSFRRVMRSSGDGGTPLWVTEIGWGSAHPDRFGHNKGLRGQKRMLKRSMNLLIHRRRAWRVPHVYWFFWRDPPKSIAHVSCSFCRSAGLLKHNRHPKPAYRAFRHLTGLSRGSR
jgi:hypothetical protein